MAAISTRFIVPDTIGEVPRDTGRGRLPELQAELIDLFSHSTFIYRESDTPAAKRLYHAILDDMHRITANMSRLDDVRRIAKGHLNVLLDTPNIVKNPNERAYLRKVQQWWRNNRADTNHIAVFPLIPEQISFEVLGPGECNAFWTQRDFYETSTEPLVKVDLGPIPIVVEETWDTFRRDEVFEKAEQYDRLSQLVRNPSTNDRGRQVYHSTMENISKEIIDGMDERIDGMMELYDSSPNVYPHRAHLFRLLQTYLGTTPITEDVLLCILGTADVPSARERYPHLKEPLFDALLKVINRKPEWKRASIYPLISTPDRYSILHLYVEILTRQLGSVGGAATMMKMWYTIFEIRTVVERTAFLNPNNAIITQALREVETLDLEWRKTVTHAFDVYRLDTNFHTGETLNLYYFLILSIYAKSRPPIGTLSHMVELMGIYLMYMLTIPTNPHSRLFHADDVASVLQERTW